MECDPHKLPAGTKFVTYDANLNVVPYSFRTPDNGRKRQGDDLEVEPAAQRLARDVQSPDPPVTRAND